MSDLELVVVALAAVSTSAFTALAGAGGGLILLIVLLQFVEPAVAIPLHGIIQLVSNTTRVATLRADVERALLRWYVAPLLPFAVVGFLVADAVPVAVGQLLIGGFALLATWWPAATRWLAPRPAGRGARFAVVGAAAGFLNPILGAPGPLLAPAIRAATSSHVAMVATFAATQVLNHTAKVIVFAVAGVAWGDHWPLLAVAAVSVVIGTQLGTRALPRIDQRLLTNTFRLAVTAGALRLAWSAFA